jgi:hypothetical protein
MTNQEAFNIAWAHLVTSKEPTVKNAYYLDGHCCAIGAMMPRKLAKGINDQNAAIHKLLRTDKAVKAHFKGVTPRLLTMVQSVNDTYLFPSDALTYVAKYFNLAVPCEKPTSNSHKPTQANAK